MTFKRLRRVLGAIALSGLCAVVPAFCGCNTAHPEAKITIEFNETEYVLEYKMFRSMYPQTVQHFIELADNGFYDNMIIHNYTSSSWYTGGYNYVADDESGDAPGYASSFAEGKEGFRDYLESASKEKEYATLADPASGKITPTVYKDLINGELSQPLTTLIGEFSNNQHKIENGALKSSFGCLRMHYSSKSSFDSVKNVRVYLDKKGSDKGVMGSYEYNSATSLFSIQQTTTVTNDSNYCIFAVLNDEKPLRELRTAISNASSKVGSSRFNLDVNIYVDNQDEYVGANVNEVSFRATKDPIVIKSVKITKY